MPTRARTTSTHIAHGQAGFTIVELLIVIVIVAIMAMTVAPSLSEVLIGNRHASCAMDLVKFGRATRSQALSSGAAQFMHFTQAGSGELGLIERYVGINNRCLQSAPTVITDPQQGPNRAWGFDMAAYNPGTAPTDDDSGQQIIKLAAQSLGTTNAVLTDLWLCYQPDGQVYAQYATGAGLAPQNLDVEFTISRSVGGEKHGPDRRVLFPIGGNARFE